MAGEGRREASQQAHPPDPSIEEVEALARRLGADLEKGLTAEEAARRLAREGPNELRRARPPGLLATFFRQLRDPLVYLLLVAIAVSLLSWSLQGGGWPVDAIVIALIVLLNAGVGTFVEARAAAAVEELRRLSEVHSSVIRGGRTLRIPSRELVPGDLLVLGEGDAVGADARLVRAASLRVQEASLTGESLPVWKECGRLEAPAALADRNNMVFSGTAVVGGTGRAIVTATGMDTELGAIADMLAQAEEEPTPLQREVARIGKGLGLAVLCVALVVIAAVFLTEGVRTVDEVVQVLLLGVSLAVAAVPEGLPAILAVVLALGVRRMAQHRAIVKRLSSVEALGSATVILSDKTGTLTRSEMTLERIATASGTTQLSGIGYAPVGELRHEGEPLREGALYREQAMVLLGGSLAGDARLYREDGSWTIHGDPTDAAFLVAAKKLGLSLEGYERIAEAPFSSERKRMSALVIDREGRRVLFAKGAPDLLLGLCSRVQRGEALVPLDADTRASLRAQIEAMAEDALRTLAVAWRPVDPSETEAPEAMEKALVLAGIVGIIDPPRPEAATAVAEAHRAGIRVLMLTGDHPRTAARIAADLGIAAPRAEALTGAALDAMNEEELTKALRETNVFARLAPAHKLRIVHSLRRLGHVVAVTGDGVNDAPALKRADIGIAMGITGTEVSKGAAKMILADDNFATIVEAVREGRAIYENINKFLRYLLSSNLGEVFTVFLGVVLAGWLSLHDSGGGLFLPLLATQILWINLITDAGPALAIGVDPVLEDVMGRPPRPLDERLIDGRLWLEVLLFGAVMAVATLLAMDLYLPGGFVEGKRELDNARTAGFTVLVLAQLFNCFNARSREQSAFRNPFHNPWLWGAVLFSLLLQIAVVHLPFLNTAFGTTPLDLGQWGMCFLLASAVLWVGELRKALRRGGRPPSA